MDIVKIAGLKNIVKTVEICHCPIHRGDVIEQVDAQLPNGKMVRILLDCLGYHVAVGNRYTIERAAPPGVNVLEALEILNSALMS